jgi:hypothetical protein
MALEDIQSRLKSDPETIEVDFAGEEKPFLFSTLGIERARAKAEPVIPKVVNLLQRFSQVGGEEQEGMENVTENLSEVLEDGDLRDLTMVVWSGFLTFDEDITLEEVQVVLTPGRIMRYGRQIAESVSSFVQEMDQDSNPAPDDTSSEEVKN